MTPYKQVRKQETPARQAFGVREVLAHCVLTTLRNGEGKLGVLVRDDRPGNPCLPQYICTYTNLKTQYWPSEANIALE